MTNSVDDSDSDLLSIENLSLEQEPCYNDDCCCNIRKRKCQELEEKPENADSSCTESLKWPPEQPHSFVKRCRTQISSVKPSSRKVLSDCGNLKNTNLDFESKSHRSSSPVKSVFGCLDVKKADFSDLAQLVCTSTSASDSNRSKIDFASATFNKLCLRTTSNHATRKVAQRRCVGSQNADINLTDLKSVLLAEERNLQTNAPISSPDVTGASQSPTVSLPCSHQALVDDGAMDELAGYFEHYCHVPKKMSEMAKMMYA